MKTTIEKKENKYNKSLKYLLIIETGMGKIHIWCKTLKETEKEIERFNETLQENKYSLNINHS